MTGFESFLVQPSAAQIQVAAATGQPLLAPGPQFVYQAQPQPFPTQTYAFRMPFESGQPQIQYITATPPSTTPSPGQAQQFHPGPQPSPASQAATAYMPMQQQGPHVSCKILWKLLRLLPNTTNPFLFSSRANSKWSPNYAPIFPTNCRPTSPTAIHYHATTAAS